MSTNTQGPPTRWMLLGQQKRVRCRHVRTGSRKHLHEVKETRHTAAYRLYMKCPEWAKPQRQKGDARLRGEGVVVCGGVQTGSD